MARTLRLLRWLYIGRLPIAAGIFAAAVWAWSGDVLMDLTKFQALRMEVREIGGKSYLFIENGGFSERNQPEWKTLWNVYER